MILIFETRGPGRKRFVERERFVVFSSEATDLVQGQLTLTFFDHLIYLQSLHTDFHFVARKKTTKRKGYTATELTRVICRRHKIPVHSLVKTSYRIPYFVMKDASIYEAIAKAYSIDETKTGKRYYIVSNKGKLQVRRAVKRSVLLAVDEESNLRSGSFSRTLPEDFANQTIPKGGDPGSKGKRRRVAASKRKRDSSAVLFGALDYSPQHYTIWDKDYSATAARQLADRLGKAAKILSVTIDGNMMVRQGDRIYVRMHVSSGAPIRREVFVSSVQHSIAAGDHTTTLICRWREKEVSIGVQGKQIKLAAKDSGSGSDSDSKTPSGTLSQSDLETLAGKHGAANTHVAGAVAMAESRGDPNAKGGPNKDGTYDHGLWQINDVHRGRFDFSRIYDPDYNAQCMAVLSSGGTNWAPWSTFKNGDYSKFM